MSQSSVDMLLGVVRRSLWRAQFVAATRLALWATTALLMMAIVALVAGVNLPVVAALALASALWLTALARAAAQRPGDGDCALWADRHLGGASAFTTLLEVRRKPATPANAQAVQWLEQWADRRAPEALLLVAATPVPTRLARPLFVMLVCLALAGVLRVLHPATPAPAPATAAAAPAASAAGALEASASLDRGPEQAPMLTELSNALRSTQASANPARDNARRGQEAGPDSGRGSSAGEPSSAQASAANSSPRAKAAPVSVADESADATKPSGLPKGVGTNAATKADANAATTTAGDPGRQPGDSRDLRADVGVSRVPNAPFPVQRSVSGGRSSSTEQQADLDRAALFDPELDRPGRTTARGALAAANTPAAATPPPAIDAARLTLTESTYVQAWMKASAQRP